MHSRVGCSLRATSSTIITCDTFEDVGTLGYIVVGILGTIGAIFLAWLAAWLQQRNWEHQNFEKWRDEQKKLGSDVALEIAAALDKRLYRQRRFLWALQSGREEAIEAARRDYVESVFLWNDNFGRFKAILWASFGDDAVDIFEGEINKTFVDVGSMLQAVHAGQRSSPRQDLAKGERTLNVLNYRSSRFVYHRLADVKHERVGGLPKFSEVYQKNWRFLSTTFLVRRLFGLTQQR